MKTVYFRKHFVQIQVFVIAEVIKKKKKNRNKGQETKGNEYLVNDETWRIKVSIEPGTQITKDDSLSSEALGLPWWSHLPWWTSYQLLRIQLSLALGNGFPFFPDAWLSRLKADSRLCGDGPQNVCRWGKRLSSERCCAFLLSSTLEQLLMIARFPVGKHKRGLGWSTLSAGRGRGARVIWVKDEAYVNLCKTSW